MAGTPPMMDDEMAGTPPMMDDDDDAKTPAQTLAAAEKALTDASTDEERAAAMAALKKALMLAGNEAAYLAYLEKKVDDQAAAAAATAAAAAAEEASDMAKAVLEAIMLNTDLGVQPAEPMVSLAASPAGVLTAKQEGYRMSAAPEEIAGWRGRTLEKDGDTTVIYTNIEDEVPTALGLIYERASSALGAPQAHLVTNGGVNDSIEWRDVKRVGTTLHMTPADADAGIEALTTFAGSVRGVDGTFSCTGANCPAPTDAEGVLTSEVVWSFASTDPGAMINVKDTGYVSFGWWLNAMGTDGYVFDAFASTGMGMAARAVPVAIEGSATYKGAAAGKYAMKSTTDDSASGGHFTAAATLTANFDANTDTGDNANELGVSIGGEITNFMTGEMSRPNWKVKLTGPAPDTDIGVTGVVGTTSWTTGGAVPGTGDWSAVFYGGMEEDQPAAVTGEFDAAIPTTGEFARISGAFGATKVPE